MMILVLTNEEVKALRQALINSRYLLMTRKMEETVATKKLTKKLEKKYV